MLTKYNVTPICGGMGHHMGLESISIPSRSGCRVHWHLYLCFGAQVMRVVDYPHFSLNKFKSLGNTFWYNALPFIMFYHAFHTSLTKPILARISLLQHSLVMFLEHRVTTHFHMYHVKYNIFGLIGHIWPPKTIIESIYLSFNLFVYLSIYLSIYLSCFTLSYTKNIYCY